jgi:hypothetical protein
MAPDHLLADRGRDAVQVKRLALGRHLRMHDDVEQQIAQFFAQVRVVAGIDGGEHLVGFLQQRGAQARVRLFAIPGAPARRAKAGRNRPQTFNGWECGVRNFQAAAHYAPRSLRSKDARAFSSVARSP